MENNEQEPKTEPRKPVSMDGMLEELRSVLSELGRAPEAGPPPLEEPINSPPPMTLPLSPPESKPASPIPLNDTPSDADFWKGNVLGWPSSIPEPVPQPEPPAPPPPSAYEKPALEGKPFSLDTPFISNNHFLDEQAPSREELPPPPRKKAEASESEIVADPWAFHDTIPEPPEAPKMSPPPSMPPAPPPMNAPEFAVDPFTVQPIEEPKPPAVTFSPAQLPAVELPEIPIPGTRLERENPAPPLEKTVDPFNIAREELKPPGLVQIACMVAPGEQKSGQQFVSKLRESGEKSKTKIKIEPVLTGELPDGELDVTSLVKSAALSGADTIFIIASRQDLDRYKEKLPGFARGGLKARLVSLEQVALRTLYADILIELERTK